MAISWDSKQKLETYSTKNKYTNAAICIAIIYTLLFTRFINRYTPLSAVKVIKYFMEFSSFKLYHRRKLMKTQIDRRFLGCVGSGCLLLKDIIMAGKMSNQ